METNLEPLLQEDGEEPIMPPSTSLLLSSTLSIDDSTVRKSRPQWSWFHYTIWVVPVIWGLTVYITQIIYGLVFISFRAGALNVVSGVLGLLLTAIRIYESWFYIKPKSWIKVSDFEEHPSTYISVLLGITSILLDMALFGCTVVGTAYAIELFGSDIVYPKVLLIFNILNLVWQWSRYGIVMFSVKLLFSWKGIQMLRSFRIL